MSSIKKRVPCCKNKTKPERYAWHETQTFMAPQIWKAKMLKRLNGYFIWKSLFQTNTIVKFRIEIYLGSSEIKNPKKEWIVKY